MADTHQLPNRLLDPEDHKDVDQEFAEMDA